MNNPFNKLANWYFTKNSLPYWSILLIDCLIIICSGFLVYWLFHNAVTVFENTLKILNSLLVFVVLSLPGFKIFHIYSGFMRFASIVDMRRVMYGNAVSLALVLLADFALDYLPGDHFIHFNTTGVVLIYIISTLLMWALRVFVRTIYEVGFSNTRALRILIYGAMSGGMGLAVNIRSQRPRRYVVKGFISHNKKARHQEILGETVYWIDENITEIIQKNDIDAVVVAPSRINEFRNNQALQDQIINAGAKVLFAPETQELNDDEEFEPKVKNTNIQLKEVSVEELLPRDEIRVDLKSVEEMLSGQRVLITGSAGSIGSEMVRQIAAFKPACMILIDQAETPQHDIRLMMAKDFPDIQAETIVTSISRQRRMNEIFDKYRPDYVFHAAAYKHVPMMEDNPSEAILNNIAGTKIIADCAVKYGVKKFVMVSTDKAVNPTNVMGCSKRICEIYVQSLGRRSKTQFVTTRFGNVLGSNGSVIPLFRQQIRKGGPVTVTHPDITRYFMLIPEACKLVLEAGTKGRGGEIFVFDMGQPVRIADLAERMIKMSKARNVRIEYTGLRPGEKLYEEVLNQEENTKPSFHDKIRIAAVREYDYEEVCRDIDELGTIALRYDDMATVRKMKEIVPEYKSNNSVYEALDGK